MSGFTKLSSNIIHSSLWSEDGDTCKLWVTLLAMAEYDGYVPGTVPGLARITALDVDFVRATLERFMQPDPDSRTKEHGGRRLAEEDGGWLVLNYSKYRAMRDKASRQVQNREAKRRQRRKEKAALEAKTQDNVSIDADSQQCQPCQPKQKQKQKQKHTKKKTIPNGISEKEIDELTGMRTDGKIKCLEFVWLTLPEKKKLVEFMGAGTAREYVERLNNYIGSKGKKYKSHYHTLRSWYNRDKRKETDNGSTRELRTQTSEFGRTIEV